MSPGGLGSTGSRLKPAAARIGRPTRPALRSASRVSLRGDALPAFAVSLAGHGVHSAGIDPAIVEIEQRAHRNGKVNRFVGPSRGVCRLHVFRRNTRRIVVYLIHKTE